jgi:hypothetical protein
VRTAAPLAATAAAALVLSGAAFGATPLPTVTSPSHHYPTRIQVVAYEFYYVLSRHTVGAGPAIVQLVDFGQDPHDLRIQRIGGARIYGTPIIQPGSIYNLSIDLLPGTYELWCSIADHRALGMEAEFTVTPAPHRG